MYICTYVCTYVCMYACMYVCIYVCTCVHMYLYMYACMYSDIMIMTLSGGTSALGICIYYNRRKLYYSYSLCTSNSISCYHLSLSMVVLNNRDWPGKNGVRNFDTSKIHLRVGFMQKNRLKCIGTSIITL